VLERFAVKQLLLPTPLADHPDFARLIARAAATDTPVTNVARGDRFWLTGQTVLTTLWPPLDCLDRITRLASHGGHYDSVNSCSLVLRLDHCDESGCRQALLMGDGTTDTEHLLLSGPDRLAADLLKIGHHGSRYSSLPEFIQAVNPDQAVIQVGELNRFGHPDFGVLLRLRASGAAIYRNDQHGTVTAYPNPHGFQLQTAR